jgi:2-iminobutanoate/2-iminopropanoate deaminase
MSTEVTYIQLQNVFPLATYLEKYKAPASTVTRHGDTIYVSGSPPFDPPPIDRCDV